MSVKNSDGPAQPTGRLPRCPQCREVLNGRGASHPFCSARCQLLDLGAWATERYRVASDSSDHSQDSDDIEGRDGQATNPWLSKEANDSPE